MPRPRTATEAAEVWQALGDVDHYIEPFCGSLAVLLNRPTTPKVETVNDLDGYIANFWRAVRLDPDAVADWCIAPVNEIDLTARHRWLCERERKAAFLARMLADPDYCDPKIAGWWVWGISAWIGSNWCTGWWDGPGGTGGKGGTANSSTLATAGVPVQLPNVASMGGGVHQRRPIVPDEHDPLDRANVRGYLQALSTRLRYVRVCNGDWKRITTPAILSYITTCEHGPRAGACGIFLDPPYTDGTASSDLYAAGGAGVSEEVAAWAFEHGDNPRLRIVLCGYEGEHVIPPTWRTIERREKGGYANTGKGKGGGENNRHRERLWLSPGCLVTERERQGILL